MKTTSALCVLSAAALGLTAAYQAQAQAYVYKNDVNDKLVRFNPQGNEVGDEIVLAGTFRQATLFDFEYYLVGAPGSIVNGDEQVKVRFYKNDGPLSPSGHRAPWTLLYESSWINIIPTDRLTVIITDLATGTTPLTQDLPDQFTWTAQFAGIDPNEEAGLDIYSPPVIGGNFTDYWEKVGGIWEIKQMTGQPATFAVDFGARFMAVPELNSVVQGSVLGLAAAGLMVWRRRSRKA